MAALDLTSATIATGALGVLVILAMAAAGTFLAINEAKCADEKRFIARLAVGLWFAAAPLFVTASAVISGALPFWTFAATGLVVAVGLAPTLKLVSAHMDRLSVRAALAA